MAEQQKSRKVELTEGELYTLQATLRLLVSDPVGQAVVDKLVKGGIASWEDQQRRILSELLTVFSREYNLC